MQESGEMYLETIYVLSKDNPNVHAIDISNHMGYSKPSVSRALGILKEQELVTVSEDGSLKLTRKGAARARKIYERHTVLTDLLTCIGVDEETASEDACRIEHYISDKTFNAIKEYQAKNWKNGTQ